MANENQNNSNAEKEYLEVSRDRVEGKEGLDLSDFKGQETEIENVRLRVWNKDTPNERLAFEIETKEFEIKGVNVRGREYINAWRDKEDKGIFHFSTKSNSNAYKLLRWFGVEHPFDLTGKTCEAKRVIQDNGNERIGIYYG